MSHHRTEKQIEASRLNGACSSGPTSAEGREASSLNSIRHGLRARGLLLLGEKAEQYQCRLDEWVQSLAPETPAEVEIVSRIADLSWRLDRLQRFEHQHIADGVDRELFRMQPATVLNDINMMVGALQALSAECARPDCVSEERVSEIAATGKKSAQVLAGIPGISPENVAELEAAAKTLENADLTDAQAPFDRIEVVAQAIKTELFLQASHQLGLLDQERGRVSGSEIFKNDKELLKLVRYRASLEASMARELELLRQVQERVQAAKASGSFGAGIQPVPVELRVVGGRRG